MEARPYNPDAAAQLCQELCILHAGLHRMAVDKGSSQWAIKPKFHMFQELVLFQSKQLGSPEDCMCYMDETWVGICSQLAERSFGGQMTAATAGLKLLQGFQFGHWDPHDQQ